MIYNNSKMDTEKLTINDEYKNENVQETDSKINSKNGSISDILLNIIKNANIKVGIFIFFIGLFIFSDAFIESILVSVVSDKNDNFETKRTVIQLLLLTLAYLIVDLIVKADIL